MIDIHTHILPEIDDGSENIETSIEQLKLMQEVGVEGVVCTPHFLRNNWHNTADIISEKFELLQNAISENNINIKLYQAAEVYLDEKSLQTIKEENFNIAGTKYVLVETSMQEFPANLYEILFQLVKDGFSPILAHPERYSTICNNIELAEEMMHKNVYLQLNAGSFLGYYGKHIRKTAWKMLERGYVHFVASDNHCKHNEYPLPLVYDVISKKIDRHTADLLTKTNPIKMLNNEKIEYFYVDFFETQDNSFIGKFKKKFQNFF